MELIRIVDEKGEFTGEIMEKVEAHDKNLLHNEIAIFIINDQKQILLQKRSANKRFNPNKWGLCAGHVTAYESIEMAALRELKEEVGLDLEEKDLHRIGEKEFRLGSTNSSVVYFYYVKTDKKESEFEIQKEELSEVKWISIDKIIEMIKENNDSLTFKGEKLPILEELKKAN